MKSETMLIKREEEITGSVEDIHTYIEQLKKKYDPVAVEVHYSNYYSYSIGCTCTISYWVRMKKITKIEWLEAD